METDINTLKRQNLELLQALKSITEVCAQEGFPHLGNILPAAFDAIDKAERYTA
jgi:hypothetical protein